jgi:alpha-D-xyloside xylohydrolase
MLVRDGTVLPHIALAQSTLQMDWSQLDLVVFAKDAQTPRPPTRPPTALPPPI